MRQSARRGFVQIAAAVAALVAALGIATAPSFGPAPALAGVASPPVDLAVDDAFSTDEDTPLTVPAPGVMGNDIVGPTSCTTATDTSTLVGQVTVNADGSFTYTPPDNYHGETAFIYALDVEGGEGCPGPYDDTGIVVLTVGSVNDAPRAVADTFQYLWNQTLNISGPGILANDSDVDGDPLTAIKATNTTRGILTLAADGGFSYTPVGATCPGLPDSFSYRASDGQANSAARVVTINPAVIPCPTATPLATPSPTPSPSPTPEPTPTPTPEPTPSGSAEASPTPDPFASPSASAPPVETATPAPTAEPAPVDDGKGLSLPVLLVIVLFGMLLAFGAAYYVPRWIEAQRTGRDIEDL